MSQGERSTPREAAITQKGSRITGSRSTADRRRGFAPPAVVRAARSVANAKSALVPAVAFGDRQLTATRLNGQRCLEEDA